MLFDLLSGLDPVRILLMDGVGVEFFVSDGVEALWDDGTEGAAWVAQQPWRHLSADERAALVTGIKGRLSDQLVVVAVQPALLKEAHQALLAPLASSNGQGNAGLSAAIQAFRAGFRSSLAARGLQLDEAGPADLIINRPGVPSTAYDYTRNRFMGLHVDNHQDLPLDQRAQAFVLANLNIGWGPRYIDFVPASVAALLTATRLDIGGYTPHPREIKDAYLRAEFRTPVVRVALPPGTAYLLNTQNCIHDGATPPGEAPDAAFLMMGNAS